MYRDPDEVDTRPSTIKTDPTAPARSAIRRQRTVRYSPNTRQPSFQTISSTTYRPSSSHGRIRVPSDRSSLLEDIRRREGGPTNSNPLHYTVNEITELEAALQGNNDVVAADVLHSQAAQRRRLESGRALLRDALSYERLGERMRIARDTTVPEAPEARRPRRRNPTSRGLEEEGNNEVATRRDQWPTPPYTSGESSENSPAHRSTSPLDTASLTPRFATAHRLSDDAEGESIAAGQTLTTRQDSLALLAERIPSPAEALNDEDRAFLTTLASELEAMRNRSPATLTVPYLTEEAAYLRSVEIRLNLLAVNDLRQTRFDRVEDLPALERMGQENRIEARRAAARQELHRGQRAWARQDATDGLGDRQRSFSPDNDTWETMLTTITPDERVPSAHSSFTSATASTASLASNSARSSYGTLVTAPSTYTDIEACPAESSGSDEDEIVDVMDEDWSLERAEARRREVPQDASRMEVFSAQRSWMRHRSRMEELSRRVALHRAHDESHGRLARDIAREEELRRLESSLRRLDRQLADERANGRSRPEERL